MKGLIDAMGSPTRPRCRRWLRGHDWVQRGRRTLQIDAVAGFDLGTMAARTVKVPLYVLRFECTACGSRAVINTRDQDVLWQLDVEIPRAGDGLEVLQ